MSIRCRMLSSDSRALLLFYFPTEETNRTSNELYLYLKLDNNRHSSVNVEQL